MTTAAFSLLNGFALRPLPFASPESLVDVSEWSATELCSGCGVGTSLPIFREWQRVASSFWGIEAAMEEPFTIAGGGGEQAAEWVSGARVSAGLFDLLGQRPMIGRSFVADEDRPGAPPVAIVSYEVWRSY